MIYFEVESEAYAIDATDLAGVATTCPYVSYPGLPEGVAGIVQWSGRIFPVLAPFNEGEIDPTHCTFVFSVYGLEDGAFPEVAIAIPGKVRAWFPNELSSAPKGSKAGVVAIAKDEEGSTASQLSLARLAQAICGGGGKKRAA